MTPYQAARAALEILSAYCSNLSPETSDEELQALAIAIYNLYTYGASLV